MKVNKENDSVAYYETQSINVVNQIRSCLDTDFSKTEIDYNEDKGDRTLFKWVKAILIDSKYHTKDALVLIMYLIVIVQNLLFLGGFIGNVIRFDVVDIGIGAFFWLFTLAPYIIWLFQTNIEALAYHNVKYGALISIFIITIARFSVFTYRITYQLVVPQMSKVETSADVTAGMIISAMYLAVFISVLIITSLCIWFMTMVMKHAVTYEAVANFKLKYHADFHKDKYTYDLDFIKDMKTGDKVKVKEKDRYLHSNAVGSTGAGKTSMIFLVSIFQDLLKRKVNITIAKKKLKKMVEKKEVYINRQFEDKDFAYEYFTPYKKYEKKFEKIKNKYRLMGITFVAPDNDSIEKVAKMFEAFRVSYNRIDPEPKQDGTYNPNTKGFNIMKISERVPQWEVSIILSKKATLLADVMQKNFEQMGKSDPYFSSVNRIATTTLAALLMITYKEIHNKDPHIGHIQDLLNDFNRIKIYQLKLDEIDKEGRYHVISDIIDAFFYQNLKFKEHCSGLIAQFNNLLSNELLWNMLCTDHSVDIDEALENARMTLVNIALGPLGTVNSPSFGQFFMNSYVDAVVRRPGNEDTRTHHTLYIDEFPVIVNEGLEPMFTLFRKYRVMVSVAVQNLSQFRGEVEYLRDVVLQNCAHQYVFGRAGIADMETYSKLSGRDKVLIHQETHSTPSIFSSGDNSISDRTTPDFSNVQEEDDVRYKDFKELLFLTTRDGRPLMGIHAKANFNERRAYKKRPVYVVDWEKAVEKADKKDKVIKDDKSAHKKNNDEKSKVKATQKLSSGYTIENQEISSVVTVIEGGEKSAAEEENGKVIQSEQTICSTVEVNHNPAVDINSLFGSMSKGVEPKAVKGDDNIESAKSDSDNKILSSGAEEPVRTEKKATNNGKKKTVKPAVVKRDANTVNLLDFMSAGSLNDDDEL